MADTGCWQKSRGKYSIRHFDDDGRENARAQSLRSATELVDWEDEFDADLNSDNRVGPGYSAIEDSDDVYAGPAGLRQPPAAHQELGRLRHQYPLGFDQDATPDRNARRPHRYQRQEHRQHRYTFTQAESDPDGGYWVLAESRGKYSIRHFDDDGRENARAQSLAFSVRAR